MIRSAPKPEILHDEGFRQWIRKLPCVLADREPCSCWGFIRIENRHFASECAHVKVRRNGDYENCVPLCKKHHGEHDQNMGPKSFEAFYEVSLKAIAIRLWHDYRTQHCNDDTT